MSFRISLPPHRRAALRHISTVRHALLKAMEEEMDKQKLTQSEVARMLGVNRSVINRTLNGSRDITTGRVAELAWALGREIEFSLPEARVNHSGNAIQKPTWHPLPSSEDVAVVTLSPPIPGKVQFHSRSSSTSTNVEVQELAV